MPDPAGKHHVVIVGGGFAGVGCARRLAASDGRPRHADRPRQLPPVPAAPLPGGDLPARREPHRVLAAQAVPQAPERPVKIGEVASVDPATHTVVTTDGDEHMGDAVVLAAGSGPNFFGTPGAAEHSFPLYALDDAERLRSRILAVFEDADRDPALIDRGALNFVVVGGGPTGVEMAGALADLINESMTGEYHDIPCRAARIHIVDLGDALLAPFSAKTHEYAAKVLGRKGVQIHLGVAVTEVGPGHVDARRRHHDPHPLRDLGRRQHGPAAGAARSARPRAGRAHRGRCPT